MASSFLKKQAEKQAKGIRQTYGEGVYGSTPYIDRVTEYEQERRDAEEEWRQRQNAQFQAERNAEIAEWIKGTSPLELENERQQQRLDYRPQYEAKQNRNISEYIKSLSPLEIEKEEQQRRIEEQKKNSQRPGPYAHTPETEAQYLYANGVRPKEEGPHKLTPEAEAIYQYVSKLRGPEPEPETYKPEPPVQKLTPDVEAERLRRLKGEEPGTALTPYRQYMAAYNAQQEQNAKKARENAESAWPGVGRTAGGMAANFISGAGQPIVNLARMMELPYDILYKITGNETFNLDSAPGLRNSEVLKESDDFAATARELREKVGPLGQQLIDAAGAAGNMLASFAFFGMLGNAAGNPVNATARMANMGGGKIGSALGRLGARAGIEILSNPGNFGISLGSAIGSYSEAYANGAGFGQALTNGLLKGMTEYYSNKLFSGTPFEDSADKGYVTKLIEQAANDLGGSDILKFLNETTGGRVMNWAFDKAGEGLEEVVTGVMDPLIDRITYDRTKDLATVEELTEEFIGGVLLSFLMEGGEAVISGLQSETKMTEREAEARLVKRGVDPKTAKKYAKDIAEAVTSMLEDSQIRSPEYDKKSIGNPETAANGANSDAKAMQRYAAVFNRGEGARQIQQGANPQRVSQTAFLTDAEAGNYYYIWNQQGAKAADAYYQAYLEPVLQQRKLQATMEYIRQDAMTAVRQQGLEEQYAEARSALGISDSFADPLSVTGRDLSTASDPNGSARPPQSGGSPRAESPLSGEARETPPVPQAAQQTEIRRETPAEAQRETPPVPQQAEEKKAETPKKKTKTQTAVAQQRMRQMSGTMAESLRNYGFTAAGETATVFVRNEEFWDAEERAAVEALRAEGYDPILFTGQTMADGKMASILQDGNRVALQADSRSKSITSLAEQILGHQITAPASDLSTAERSPSPVRGGSELSAGFAGSPPVPGEARSTPPAPQAPTQGKLTTRSQRAQRSLESARQNGVSQKDAELAARLSDVLGRDILWYNDPARGGTWEDGKTVGGAIYINAAVRKEPVVWVVAHELTHNTENAKVYKGLKNLAKQAYKAAGKDWQAEVDRRVNTAKGIAETRGNDNYNLTPEMAEQEMTADWFADDVLTNEARIRQIVQNDPTTARGILSYLKNLLQKLKGKEPTIERAIDLYSKALKEVAAGAQEKGAARGGLTVGNKAGSAKDIKNQKYSVQSIFNAAGFQVTMRGGRVIATDGNGQRITEMTEDMVRRSGIGTMIRYAQEVTKSISKAEAQTQVEGLTRLFNLMLKAQDGDMVWRFAGSAMFSAVKSNSDGQYSTTVDFSTVCKKTEEMMRTMSTVMKRTHKGLTKDQIIELQNDILAENGLVPCPVCYVFSRWAGVGGILDNMANFQRKYDGAEWDDPARMKARIDQLKAATKSKKSLQALLMEEDNAYQQYTGELEANKAEQKTLKEERKTLTKKKADAEANEARIAEIDQRLKELDGLNTLLTADIKEIEKSGAPEAAWLERVRSKPNYREDGYVEEDLLYDLLAADRLAEEKPLAWGYRTSRGPSAGKAILPYSDMRIGDWVLGPKSNSAKGANPLFSSVGEQFSKDQSKAIDAAKMKVLAQNLIGGQRYQSTSDFMYDYGLDYLLSFFEGQMLGSKMQTYTKVMEFVNLVASVHGDVNISMMPLDAGYVTEEDGRQHLIYSSVTGANPEAAIRANHLFDNAQLILVGINDEHILLALEDSEETGGSEIGFVIPYHASGASINNFIRGLVENLKETFDERNYKNYEPMQNDSHRGNATATQEARERLRRYLLTGKRGKNTLVVTAGNADGLTETEVKLLKGKSKDISGMSFEELRDIEKRALAGDKNAIKEYESWSAGFLGDIYKKMWTNQKAKDTYGVRLTGDQPNHIMPHEFWDTRVDREHAYINGFRFRSYCYSLGLVPRFTGINSAGKHLGYGDFSDSRGYWKTLIDRPMYDRNGKYREQQTMNVTELSGSLSEESAGMLSPEYGREFWGENAQTPDTGVAARAAERYLERHGEQPRFSARMAKNLYRTQQDFTEPMNSDDFLNAIREESKAENYFPKGLSKEFMRAITRKAVFNRTKLYRGIEAAEYDFLMENKFLKSKGEYNFSNQEDQTLADEDPATALAYATSFAPKEVRKKHYEGDMLPSYIIEFVNSPDLNMRKNEVQESYTKGTIDQEYITRIFEITYDPETHQDMVQDVTERDRGTFPKLGEALGGLAHGEPMFFRDKTTGTILYAVQGDDGWETGQYISEKDPSMIFDYDRMEDPVFAKHGPKMLGISGNESDLEGLAVGEDGTLMTKEEARNSAKMKNGLSLNDMNAVQSIPQKSVNDMGSKEIQSLREFARMYWTDLREKSPFFRAWFGDWRVNDHKTKVIVANQKGTTKNTPLKNEDTGWEISISGIVENETTRQKSYKSRMAVPYLDYLNDIVKKAVLLDSYTMGAKQKSANSIMMHSFYAVADIGNGPELVKLYVEEMNDPNKDKTGKRTYKLLNIENTSPASARVQGQAPSPVTNTGNAIKTIADLAAAVKAKDNEYKPRPSSVIVDDDGNPKVVYHQTAADIDEFRTDNPGAAKYDSETPNGSFFKDNDHDIGIGGDKQMPVYLDVKKPLHFKNREEANQWYCEHVKGYKALQDEMNAEVSKYDKRLEELDTQMFKAADRAEEDRLSDEWDAVHAEMGEVENKYRGQLRELLNDYFLKNDSGYDGIILDYDGHRYVDGKREDVKTYIVFKNTQVKSATENIGTFDKENPKIRYSARTQQAGEGLTSSERSAEALEGRLLGSRELLGTPALKKIGVKVSGSVGRYANTEQLKALNKAAKDLKKAAQDAERRLRPTEAEMEFASGIAAMVYDEEDIPARLRRDVVMELADYYFASDSANLDTLARVRADINAGLRAEAGDLLEDAEFKPQSMLLLNERTPERNFRAMFGDRGEEIAEWLVQPVRENEAEKIRWFNAQLDKVREFTDSTGKKRELTRAESALTMKYMEGTAAAQMIADLETDPNNRYGKQTAKNIKNAAQNIRNGESAADAAKEFSLSERDRDLATKYAAWQNTLQELKEADSTIVENAAKAYAELFDDYYDAINDFLVAHGYEPIGYIKGYAPHMQPEGNQDILAKALKGLGVNAEVKELPASIAGQTANFKPNKRWNPYFLRRTGDTAEYDIVKAFESYVDYMSDVLYHTDDIMRARQMVRWIRQTFAPEEIRSKLDYIDTIRQAPAETKAMLLKDAGEIGQTTVMSAVDTETAMQEYVDKLFEEAKNTSKYSNLVMWLENYANILAGKQSFADRGWEYSTGRKSLNWANRLNAAFQKSNVAGNLSSALNQTAQLPMIAAELGERDFLGGLMDVVTGKARKGNWAQDSDFLTEKEGKDYLYADNADKFIDALYKPASWMDHLVSTIAVRGAFNKAVRQGMGYERAMRYADDFGRKLMGSRAKGSRPLAYESKGFFSKMVHMFQVEAVNSWDHIVSDLPHEIQQIAKTQGKAKAATSLAALIIRALLGAFLLNRATEEIYGGTPAPFDILGLAANFVASGQGLTTNRWMKKIIDNAMEKMGGSRVFGTKATEGNEEFDTVAAGEELVYNVMNDLPLIRNAAGVLGLGDQTVPLPGASGEFKDIGKAVSNLLKEGVDEGEIADLLRATLKTASQFLPGGRQIRKTAEGAETVIRGGSYKNGKLQFHLEGAADTGRALAFGKSATEASRDYWAAGGKALSEKQTGLYEDLVDEGMSRREAYETITGYRDDGTLNDYIKWTDSRSRDAGIGEDTYLQFRADTAGITGDPDGKGGTVSGSKKAKVVEYIDGLDLTPDQKTAMLLDYNSSYSLKDVNWTGGAPEAKPAATPAPTAAPTATPAPTPAPTAAPLTAKGQGYYDSFVAAGIGKDKADSLARELETSSAGGHEQWRIIYSAAGSDGEKAVTAIMTEDMKRNWNLAKNVGVTMDDYIRIRENYLDLNENGKKSQDEWNATLDQFTFSSDKTKDQKIKGTLWQILTGSESTKNNPYDKAAGKAVIDAKSGSYAPARLVTRKTPEAPRAEKPRGGLIATGRSTMPATRTGGLVLKKK